MASEQCIFIENKIRSHVGAVGTCSLNLDCSFVLNLKRTYSKFLYKLNFSFKTCTLRYSFEFYGTSFLLFCKSSLLAIVDWLIVYFEFTYKTASFYLMQDQSNAGIKRYVMNKKSSMLWHRRFGHISIERLGHISMEY